MAMHAPSFGTDLVKIFLMPMVSIFVIPLCTWLFVSYATSENDARIVQAIGAILDRDTQLDAASKELARTLYRALPPSSVCGRSEPQLQVYREQVCSTYSPAWQFQQVRKVSLWSMVAGVALLIAVFALGALAFVNRRMRHISFLVGWRLLTAGSALGVTIYAALAVWLSFWVTAVFFQRYAVNLIVLVGLLAALLVALTVWGIFKRTPQDNGVAGKQIGPEDAPALWAHLHDVAARLGTRSPDHVVAGIDANFFVTEAPLTLADRILQGRTLFISLPLLRMLGRDEADAVLAHELAHLRGGDAASSAALGPMLVHYDRYSQLMAELKLTLFVHHLLRLYRSIFEFALRRDSRSREFLADRAAAEMVSAPSLVRSLVKISAYASYRAETERELFSQDQRHEGPLGIAQRVASGLAPYAASPRFLEVMKSASVPHPFDSHPSLQQRMSNVGHRIDEADFSAIAGSIPAQTWVSDIPTADDIERRLWTGYEQRFALAHEQNLAYRYEPANEAEAAIVLKHFPTVAFPLDAGQSIVVSIAGLVLPGASQTLAWDLVADLKYEYARKADTLYIVHPDGSRAGDKQTEVKLPGIKEHSANLSAALGHYWHRHKVMRQYQTQFHKVV